MNCRLETISTCFNPEPNDISTRTNLPCIDGDIRCRGRSQDSHSDNFVEPVVGLASRHEREVDVSNATRLRSTSSLVDLDVGSVMGLEGLAHIRVVVALSVLQVPVSTDSNNSA
jgi:hypothetical protein